MFKKNHPKIIALARRSPSAVRLAALLLSSACTTTFAQLTPGKSEIYQSECRLGTESPSAEQYHALIYYPNEYALRVPGIVIGAEKSSTDQVRRGALLATVKDTPDGVPTKKMTADWLRKVLQGGKKAVFISHVVAFDGREGNLIFDAYRKPEDSKEIDIPSDLKSVPWLDCKRSKVPRFDAFADSWQAIQVVKDKIATDIAKGDYTHVLLIAMGWNTVQIEAMQNYSSILRNLEKTAKSELQPFKPYVVGFTWPSQWDSSFFGPGVVRPVSLLNKANDADEFAAGWLGASIRYGVIPALAIRPSTVKRPQVVAIGHSFGARAISHAICRGTVLSPQDATLQSSPLAAGSIDTLISLQGAYSLNRFKAEGAGAFNLAYAPGCPAASTLVFTASRHDSAAEFGSKLPGPLWAGSLSSWEKLKREGAGFDSEIKFKLCAANADGSLSEDCRKAKEDRFLYFEASELIKYQPFGAGGGAHSDIYKAETGEFLWNFMSRN